MRTVTSTDGVELATYELDGPPGMDPPTAAAVMAHANGLCGSVWGPVAARLAGARCLTFDFRAHGRSSRPVDGNLHWDGTAEDVLAVVDAYGSNPVWGIGHSMGGAALLLAEIDRPGTFAGLWLFEPIVIPPGIAAGADEGGRLAAGALRRRERFPDRATARANFAGKPPLNALCAEALDAYLDGGFEVHPDGSLTLRCRPQDEAQNYRMGASHGAYEGLAEVGCPVVVARGGDPWGPSTFAPLVVERLPHGRLADLEGLGHFGPLQDPTLVAAEIAAAMHG